MKKITSAIIFLCTLCSLLLTDSCKKETVTPTPTVTLQADAGPDQTAAVLSTVTLDGTASTGDGTLDYTWVYNGPYVADESAINFQNKNSVKATFVPPVNGTYTFTLEVRKTPGSNQFLSQDQVTVTVSGFISIGGTLASNLTLVNVEQASTTLPDYKITSDLIIPAGITVSSPGGIVIEVADNVAIRIQGGSLDSPSPTKFTSSAGWKGILLESGTLKMTGEIQNAGKNTIGTQTEAAAITALSGSLTVATVEFTGTTSTSYDLLIAAPLTLVMANNIFSTSKPIKMPINNLNDMGSNTFATYDYITLTTPGGGTSLSVAAAAGFLFSQNFKFYIDGDFTSSSPINVQSNTTILMKAGAGILASAGINTHTGDVFDGLNSAPWKGIAIGGGTGYSIIGTQIKNAGSAVFNTGSFTSDVKAAIYLANGSGGAISSTEIKDSQGYGYYVASPITAIDASGGNTFTNTALPAISAPVNLVSTVLNLSTVTFTMPSGVAAFEVRVPNATTSPVGTWQPLGGSNYYLFTNNVFQNGGLWTLSPGVNLKLKTDKSINVPQGLFSAVGTALKPITIDSEAGAAGSWAGLLLESYYNIEFCQIKNGGSTNLFKGGVTPATELANVVFNTFASTADTFKNNTISGGAGYGILVESGKQNPDAANPINANTFSTNALGNIIVK